MQSRSASVTLIVAATLTNGIGASGRLPWRLSKEMAYFAKVTSFVSSSSTSDGNSQLQNAVIMGRKTWESIPLKFRPLKERINIIVSRGYSDTELEDTIVKTNSIDEACTLNPSTIQTSTSASYQIHRRFLIGGAELYRHALANPSSTCLDRILLTRILEPAFEECDVHLPEFRSQTQVEEEGTDNSTGNADESAEWRKAPHEELSEWVGFDVPEGIQEEKGIKYQFQMWVRQRGGENN